MEKYIGWIIVGTLAVYLLNLVMPVTWVIPALLAWLVPVLMWPTFGRGIRTQALVLMALGIITQAFSAFHGIFLGWKMVLTLNLPLLAMFVAVSFLSLTSSDIEQESLPTGKSAAIKTAVGIHLLASVINMSVLFVFGDRIQKNGTLNRSQQIILARSFCSAAWWSPFFVATGVALTYAPGMSWQRTLLPGALMSLLAIGYSIIEVCYFSKDEFSGYPFKVNTLTMPVHLSALVLCVHYFKPEMNVLNIICILSPAGALVFMKYRPRVEALRYFINNRLKAVGSQFVLFLAAGIFSAGIKSVILVYPELFSLSNSAFTPVLFSIILGLVIIAGMMGVHPIVSISIISPLLLPLNMDPSQLGFLFLSSWAISTGSSPLSGVGLALVSRYQVSARGILQSNWHYAVMMWASASLMNIVFFVR
jgi:hypothetical protein